MLNVNRPDFREAVKNEEVVLWRNKTMGNVCYRYFVTSATQRNIFLYERKYGTEDGPNKAYHVYVDEDVDRNSAEYRFRFRLSREIDC